MCNLENGWKFKIKSDLVQHESGLTLNLVFRFHETTIVFKLLLFTILTIFKSILSCSYLFNSKSN